MNKTGRLIYYVNKFGGFNICGSGISLYLAKTKFKIACDVFARQDKATYLNQIVKKLFAFAF